MTEQAPVVGAAIYRHLVSGSLWMVAARWSLRAIGLVNIVILARLLMPQDFGVIAMSAVVIGFFEISTQLGVDAVLIRHADATPDHFNTGWTIRLLQRCAVAALIVLCAPLAASYFDEPRVVDVIRLLALGVAISGFQNIGTVLFRKELNFSKDFRFTLYGQLLRIAVTIVLAVVWRSYWALAVGMVAGSLCECVLSYTMHPLRPRPCLRFWREFVSFSMWTMPTGVAEFLANRTDVVVVGGLGNTALMGAYNVALEISNITTRETATSVSRALLPGYAKVKHSWAHLREVFLNVVATTAILSFALGFGLAVVAEDFVVLVLGPQWLSAIPLVQFLAIAATMSSLSRMLTVQILVVTGHERRLFALTWLQLVVLVPAVVLAGQHWGAEAVAATRAAVSVFFIPLAMWFLARAVSIGAAEVAAVLWRPLVAALAMMGVVHVIDANTGFAAYIALPLSIAAGALTYVAALAILWAASRRPSGPEGLVFNLLLQRVSTRPGQQ